LTGEPFLLRSHSDLSAEPSNRSPYDVCMPLRVAEPGSIHRIYLTGFMGAGKSTVGALLAEKLNWRFFDTDGVIEQRARASVSALFDDHGESYFRQLEVEALNSLQSERAAVISLGGGAVETEEIRSLLAHDAAGILVFLDAPLSRMVERCVLQETTGVTRPLLNDRKLLESRFERRLAHYRTAHLTVATQALNPEEVAASILKDMAASTKWK
jgi:shikimate kinase